MSEAYEKQARKQDHFHEEAIHYLRKFLTLHVKVICYISLNSVTLPGRGLYSDLES